MSNILKTIKSILAGKKTITKFTVGDYDIRFAFLGKVDGVAAFERERMNAALEEAMRETLLQFLAEERWRKKL